MNLSAATSLFAMAMRPRLFASKPAPPEPVQGPLRAVLEASQTVLCVTDAIGVVRSITTNASRILGDGADRAAELEVTLAELLQIEDISESQAAIDELTRSEMGSTCVWVFRTRSRKGTQRWIEVVGANYLFESQIAGLFLQVRDVTKTYPAQQRHELAGLAAEMSPDTVIITNSLGVIEYVNPAFEKISGYRLSDVRGRTPAILKSDRQPADFFNRMWNALKVGDVFRGEVTNRKKTGEVYYEDLQIQPIVGVSGVVTHYISVGRDVTAQRRAESVAEESAFYDPVSGIPTFRLLRERARPLLSLARRHGHTAALVHIDLNGLHNVNVSLGRDVGDQLMRKFAERLKQGLRESDTIARLPSDEFLIMLTDVAGEDATARVSRRLKESVTRPFQIREHSINLGTSFGVSMYPQDATTFDEMIDYASLAMKRAKVTGTGFEFYKKELTELTLERLSLEDDLKWAWERKQFVLHYQGVFSTADNSPVGMEALTRAHIIGADALSRWPNIERGEISPAQFIPVAERTGRIVALDRWALATAARQAKIWAQEGWNGWVSVNLSARSLHDADLPAYIARCIETHEIANGRLVLEVTESSAMREIETTAAILNQLKEAGALIALDDFGTGHSSLAYLKHFPVDILKLDHSFVAGIGTEKKQEHLITTMVDFSHRIGAQVVAEGVETQDQMDFLRDAKCDFVQGYLLARPKPVDALFKD